VDHLHHQATSPFVSVVIPAYNEEENLPTTIRVLIEKLTGLVPSFELLVVNDASRDQTGLMAERLAAHDSRVRVFHHPENRGIGGGFVTGVQNARGEWFMLIPADLALDPDELIKYFNAAQAADVIIGIRSDKSDYTLFRRLVSATNIRLVQLLFGMRESQFQYISLYRARLFREIEIEFYHSAFFFAEILIKARARGYRLTQVDIRYIARAAGRATGANLGLILRTGGDMMRFWLHGDWRKRNGIDGKNER
jgi:glycosyltransferase involved in cell wall biosynthesis